MLAMSTRRPARRASAFTLIELLVVMVIIVLLIGAVVTVGRGMVQKGRARETQAVLKKLELAAGQFASEKPLGKVPGYQARYGDFPPDELDGFLSTAKIPGTASHIAPSGSDLVVPMDELVNVENGDIKAFALAVRLYSEQGAFILDDVAPKYRRAAAKDPAGVVVEYLARSLGPGSTFTPGEDEPLDYFVDAWGTPISYFSTFDPTGNSSVSDLVPNVAHDGDRARSSFAFVELNNNVPLFVSYGADGPEQFSADFEDVSGFSPDLVFDLYDNRIEIDGREVLRLDHAMNADNVYSSDGLATRMLQARFSAIEWGGGG